MADSVARGLALIALGKYNELIKIKKWTVKSVEQIQGPDLHRDPAITEKENVQLKVNYEYWDSDDPGATLVTSSFIMDHGRGIHYYGLNIGDVVPGDYPSAAYQDQFQDEHGNWLGYNATHYFYIIEFIDGRVRELKVPIVQTAFKKIILDWDTHHGILPEAATAEDNAIYYLEQEKRKVYLLYVRTLDKSVTPNVWTWTNIGSTEFDLTEYQKKIDKLIKFKTTNYDATTSGANPTVENVVGSANQALAAITPIVKENSFTFPIADWTQSITESVILNKGSWVEDPSTTPSTYKLALDTRLDPASTPTTTISGVTVARTASKKVTFTATTKPTSDLTGTLSYTTAEWTQTKTNEKTSQVVVPTGSPLVVAWNSVDSNDIIFTTSTPTTKPTTELYTTIKYTHTDISSDISNLGTISQILNTLDSSFTKRTDIVTAINEHEKELKLVYDYALRGGRITNLSTYDGTATTAPGVTFNHEGHNQNVAHVLNEIGNMFELDYIPITPWNAAQINPYVDYDTTTHEPTPKTGYTWPDAWCWELDNYKWTLVDAINAAGGTVHEVTAQERKDDPTIYDATYFTDFYTQGHKDVTTGKFVPDPKSDIIGISRDDIKLRANAGVNQYKTYDLYRKQETYDMEIAPDPQEITVAKFTLDQTKVIPTQTPGVYQYTLAVGNDEWVCTAVEHVRHSLTSVDPNKPVPVPTVEFSDGNVRFTIGSETNQYKPGDTTDWIEIKYTYQHRKPYGRIDIPHLKIHKVTEIPDVPVTEDTREISKSSWYQYEHPDTHKKSLIYYHELWYAAVDTPVITGMPTGVEFEWNPATSEYPQGVGKNVVIFVYQRTIDPPPTEGPGNFTPTVKYDAPSDISCKYYLEYEGETYSEPLCGSTIDIQKDKFLRNVTVKTCTVKDKPVPGLNVGDKYIDFEFVLESLEVKHAYVICKDLGIPIIDTDALPTENIQENFFYRTKDETIRVSRHALTDEAIKLGYEYKPEGLYNPTTTPATTHPWAEVLDNWPRWTTRTPVVINPADDRTGPLYILQKTDGSRALAYNYNQSPVTLQFHNPTTNQWVDMISKYKAVNTFDGVTGKEWEIYVLLNDTDTHKKGVYIWDRDNFIAISSISEAIIDVEELPEIKIEEKSFYRIKDTDTITARYDLTDAARRAGWVLTPDHICQPDNTQTEWEVVDDVFMAAHATEIPETVTTPYGPIYKITHKDATVSYVYNYNRDKVNLKVHDEPNNRWIDILPRYKVVSKLPATGEDYQIYFVLNEMYSDGRPGVYIWDEKQFVQVYSPAITELTSFTKTREGEFYSYHDDTKIQARYRLSDSAKKENYICDFKGITKDGTLTSWADIKTNETYWFTDPIPGYTEPVIIAEPHGDIYKVDDPTDTTKPYKYVYNFKGNELGLKYYDFYSDKWVNLVSKYKAVNTFKDETGALIPGEDWELYILLNNTPDYSKGTYIWDRTDYVCVSGGGEAIIDTPVLPVVDIEENKFYRLHDETAIVSRWKLSDYAIGEGYILTPDGIKLGTDLTPWNGVSSSVLADWDAWTTGTDIRIITDPNGPIFRLKESATATTPEYLAYNFNTSPVSLQFHDLTTNDWVEMISKYEAVNSFYEWEEGIVPPTRKLKTGKEWQIYVLLNDDLDPDTGAVLYRKGIYIWDRNNYVTISSVTDCIIDVDGLPTLNINDNAFYRTKPTETVMDRYDLSDDVKENGGLLTAKNIFISDTEYYEYTNITAVDQLITDGKLVLNTYKGKVSKITSDGGTTWRYEYKFVNPSNSLQYHNSNGEWTNVIAKNNVVKALSEITNPSTTENYVLIEDWADDATHTVYPAGEYIWDGFNWLRISTNTEKPILDEKPIIKLDGKYNEFSEYFFRTEDKYTIEAIYGITPEAVEAGYKVGINGLTLPDATQKTWGEVLGDWTTYYDPADPTKPIVDNNRGDIFKISRDYFGPTVTFLAYNYNSSPITLEFWDDTKNEYIEVISKYEGINTFDDGTGALNPGREYQIYVLLNSCTVGTEVYEKGIYIWNGKDYISATDNTKPIIDVEKLPTKEIKDEYFYRTHKNYEVAGRFKLEDSALEKGYNCTPYGLYDPIGTEHNPHVAPGTIRTWEEIYYYRYDEWLITPMLSTGIFSPDLFGELYAIKDDYTTPIDYNKFIYNFNDSKTSLQYYDSTLTTWVEMVSKYKAVNTFFTDTWDIIPGEDWQIYMLLNDVVNYDTGETFYKRGVYVWDRGRDDIGVGNYYPVSTFTDCIIDVDGLPTLNINDNAFYRTKTKDTTETRYDLSNDEKDSGAYLTYDIIYLSNGDQFGYSILEIDTLIGNNKLVEVTDGPISKINNGTTVSYKYKFINPLNSLQYHNDNYWTDVIAKNKVVDALPATGQSTTENYVLLEDWVDMSSGTPPFPKYTAGEYIWDGEVWQRVATNTEKPIISEKPIIRMDGSNPLNEYFVREYDLENVETIYAITPEHIKEGYKAGEEGITKPDGNVIIWTDRARISDLITNGIITENNKGDIFCIGVPPMYTRFTYNYNSSPITLEFWDESKREYIEVISKFEGATSFTDHTMDPPPIKEGRRWQLYVLLNDDINPYNGETLYKRGIYIWNGKDYISAASSVTPIVVVNELPTTNIDSTVVYELRKNNTLPTVTCYEAILDPGATPPVLSYVDIYGLHYITNPTEPDPSKFIEEIVCFADLFLNWATYSSFFREDTATPTTGTIWKIEDTTTTPSTIEFRWSDTKPELVPEKRTQFYVYNEETSTWKLLADDNNSINGVYNHNEGKQTSESLQIIWEGSKTEYEALTKINPSTLYLVHNGEGKGPTISYNTLDDRPMINHVLLQGDTTLQELGLTAFLYKDTVAVPEGLPTTGNEQGDLYYVSVPKEFYAWNGVAWKLAGTDLADFSKYQLKEDLTLKTTAKEVVPAINEIFDNMAIPEALTVTCTPATGSQVTSKGWYTASTKEIRFSVVLDGLNITEEKENFTLGTIGFATGSGTLAPEFKQAVASCDLDGKVSTNIFIAPDGTVKANIYMGHHSLKETELLPIENIHSYYTEGFTLNQLSISGTIFCN